MRTVLCLLAALSLQASTTLFQNQADRSWTTVHGSVVPDDSVRHNDQKSLRMEASSDGGDAVAHSSAIHLVVGKTYEISGWVRTENLTVKDLGRSPISSGATISMESMPFDVHAESVGGTHDWTRLALRFVATREEDHIVVSSGNGGDLKGRAWFEGVTIDEASAADSWPAKEAVRTFGPAYRYPNGGWIYLHIEGKPYERGYQHGYLMAREIPEYLTRCAIDLDGKADEEAWRRNRTTADALFLRGFNKEILEEMRGIADGANAGGAKFFGHKLDLIDIVVANTTVEMGELAAAMPMTPTGLEGTEFSRPGYGSEGSGRADHCSAFAATGPATRDGKMVIGHVTWWSQTLAEQTNVMLDIKPETGHRMLIQSYPGGIESGTDWYQNDAGIVLTETTIEQTPFNVQGTPVAFRARMAIQYADNIDDVVKELGTSNNGLYTNEWIIGDAKNNEIAMYELGTKHTKLWRSSKNEWFGNTAGFYWGDNNSKDLTVNLEYLPDPHGAPEYVPYVPGVRDLAWMKLYEENKGRIDEQFGFKAYDASPLVSGSTMDAKIATADMANHMMVWAEFGRPNESVAAARDSNHGLFPGGYRLLDATAPASLSAAMAESSKKATTEKKVEPVSWSERSDKLWKGWLLPASDEDDWFVAGSAQYYHVLQAKDVDEAINEEKIRYRGLKLAPDTPANKFRLVQVSGVLFLDSLRHKMGDDAFLKLMNSFYDSNTTKTVSAQMFLQAAQAKYEVPDVGDGPAYLASDLERRLASVVIVYGTVREAGTNRYVAEQLQAHYRERGQGEVPIYRDFEAGESLIGGKDVVFVGRPESNSALAAWQGEMGLDYTGAMFKLEGKSYASERNALVFAAKNPRDAHHMVLVYAGNSPLETARASQARVQGVAVALEDGKPESRGVEQ